MARWGDGGSKILDTPLMLPQNRATDINLRSSPQCPQKTCSPQNANKKPSKYGDVTPEVMDAILP